MVALMDMDDFIAMIVILIILAGVTTLWVIINDKEK